MAWTVWVLFWATKLQSAQSIIFKVFLFLFWSCTLVWSFHKIVKKNYFLLQENSDFVTLASKEEGECNYCFFNLVRVWCHIEVLSKLVIARMELEQGISGFKVQPPSHTLQSFIWKKGCMLNFPEKSLYSSSVISKTHPSNEYFLPSQQFRQSDILYLAKSASQSSRAIITFKQYHFFFFWLL